MRRCSVLCASNEFIKNTSQKNFFFSRCDLRRTSSPKTPLKRLSSTFNYIIADGRHPLSPSENTSLARHAFSTHQLSYQLINFLHHQTSSISRHTIRFFSTHRASTTYVKRMPNGNKLKKPKKTIDKRLPVYYRYIVTNGGNAKTENPKRRENV